MGHERQDVCNAQGHRLGSLNWGVKPTFRPLRRRYVGKLAGLGWYLTLCSVLCGPLGLPGRSHVVGTRAEPERPFDPSFLPPFEGLTPLTMAPLAPRAPLSPQVILDPGFHSCVTGGHLIELS
jgi:hypothetical protein